MKQLLIILFVAAAVANPVPIDEDTGEPVELVVNGLAEGEPLEIGHILDVKVKEHLDGQIVSATNLLHPFTAEGIAEAAAAGQESKPESPIQDVEILPELVMIAPELDLPSVIPGPVVLPEPPAPEVEPEIVLAPELPHPELDLTPVEILPAPVKPPNGEVFNDGTVQVTVNAPETGVFSTVQSWLNIFLNYFNGAAQTTHQIV